MAAGGDIMPFLAMVLVQMGYAGMNITSKLAMESGMSPFVLVAYRQVVATISIIPFAYWLEWKTRPKITLPVLVQAFFCSITGVTMNQVFYFVGLKNSTPTIACALSNILPAVTFVLAVIFRQESVGIKRMAGQAKVLGTTMCVGGAMLLSFYHGHIIGISEPSVHWKYAEKMRNKDSGNQGNLILGPFMLLASCVGCAAWFVIQARMSNSFPAPYISTGLMCLMGSIQCGIIAIFTDHKISAWPLTSTIRLLASLYAGLVGSALAVCLTSWSIQRKGPLYASIFSPLLLVIVALLSWALLEEKLYIGTAVGSVLIVVGLYAVIWGSDRERKLQNTIEETETMKPQEVMKLERKEKDDLESQTFSNGNHHHVTTTSTPPR